MKKLLFCFCFLFLTSFSSANNFDNIHILVEEYSMPLVLWDDDIHVGCIGNLINKNTVLTARHCLAYEDYKADKAQYESHMTSNFILSDKVDLAVIIFNEPINRKIVKFNNSNAKKLDILYGVGVSKRSYFDIINFVILVEDTYYLSVGRVVPGNSGTGLFDMNLGLSGLVSYSFTNQPNMNGSISVKAIRAFLEEHNIEYETKN